MACQREYHRSVKRNLKCDASRLIPATLAAFGLLVYCMIAVPNSQAQTGAHASASSSASGHASSASGHASSSRANSGTTFHSTVTHTNHGGNSGQQSHIYRYPYGGIYAVGVPVPYPDNAVDNSAAGDPNDQGGPTIFDRSGSGPQSYIPPVADAPDPHTAQSAAPDPPDTAADADSNPEPTLLVFKDGHQIEVGNYAIVGHTLYDMSPGHPRKVALADLDMDATEKQNDQRGVTFQLPPSARVN